MTDFNELFNQAAAADVATDLDNTYGMRHGDILKLGIVGIQPIKKELDGVVAPAGTDPRVLVPWNEGLSLNVVVLAVKDVDGNKREMVHFDEEGKVSFPHGTLNVDRYIRVTSRDITGGFVRMPIEGGRSAKILWPAQWDKLSPAQRLSYWMHWMCLKYALPKGSLQEGTVFYAFHTVRQGKEGSPYEGKIFSDISSVLRDPESGNFIPAPGDVRTYPLDQLRAAKQGLVRAYEAWKAAKEARDTSFEFGANTYDADAGF